MVVKEELKKIGLHFIFVDLGEIEIMEDISDIKRALLRKGLLESGLELMDDKKSILIEKIKNVIIEMVHYSDEMPKVNYSDYISEKLNHDYNYYPIFFLKLKELQSNNLLLHIRLNVPKNYYCMMNTTLQKYLTSSIIVVWRICPINLKKLRG